jgi:hypothetical protein
MKIVIAIAIEFAACPDAIENAGGNLIPASSHNPASSGFETKGLGLAIKGFNIQLFKTQTKPHETAINKPIFRVFLKHNNKIVIARKAQRLPKKDISAQNMANALFVWNVLNIHLDMAKSIFPPRIKYL